MRQIFITGTDTDVGKTYISSIIFNILEFNTCYFKPIQTGCIYENNKLTIPDVDFVKNNSNIKRDENFSCCYPLSYPVSPHLSSELSDVKIDILKIINEFNSLKNKFKNILVEGAGGIFTPINRDNPYFMYDLIKDLNIKPILVTNTKVGTINHTLLTLEYLKKMDIPIHGVVFNKFQNTYFEKDNITFITKYFNLQNTLIIHDKNYNNNLNSKEILRFIKNI